jgi:nitrite reductase (NADH) large subunit
MTAAPADTAVRLVIVGSGIAGVAAAEAARGAAPGAEITLVSSERELPYYRLNLTRYLAGEITRDALPIHPEAWYAEQRVRLLRGEQVAQLDTGARTVSLADGATLPYDRLILTAGSHPHVPPLPGIELDGVFSLRTAADADGLLARLTPATPPCVCIGGGVLGIETAAALARRGAAVTLLEGHDWLMPRQLNAAAAAHLERHLNKLGVTVLKQARTQALEGGTALEAVRLLDGRRLHARLAVLATGVRPNTALARRAGLAVNTGVIVDSVLATSADGVYAAGDAAEFNGLLYGTWAASQTQGTIAGRNAVGGDARFDGIPRSNTIKAVGLDLTSIGRFQPEDGGDLLLEENQPDRYCAFVFRDNRMVGALLVGHADLATPARRAIEEGLDFSLLLAAPTCAAITERLRAQT